VLAFSCDHRGLFDHVLSFHLAFPKHVLYSSLSCIVFYCPGLMWISVDFGFEFRITWIELLDWFRICREMET
jgi:hypothetical protein